MKTLAQILFVAGLATMVACGPSKEQLAEQARLDSIRIADSIALVEAEAIRIQDSINAVLAEQQRIADSIIAAEAGKKK